MFITPITPLGQLDGLRINQQIEPGKTAAALPFQDVFKSAVENLIETDRVTNSDSAYLAAGEFDDLHALGINATKAYLATRMVVEVRNRAMEAYSEIMRINV